VRQLYQQEALAGRIAAHIVLDGAGADSAVTQALGSRRYRVTVTGPGGHSFTDAGTPNPITALVSALAVLAETQLPEEPRTTLNVGTIQGGTSVNSIPERAQPLSISAPPALTSSCGWRSLASRRRRLRGTLERAGKIRCRPRPRLLAFKIDKIGDRRRATARRLALAGSTARRGPPSGPAHRVAPGLDRRQHPALAGNSIAVFGRGGEGGGAHTLAEWYSAKDRETA